MEVLVEELGKLNFKISKGEDLAGRPLEDRELDWCFDGMRGDIVMIALDVFFLEGHVSGAKIEEEGDIGW